MTTKREHSWQSADRYIYIGYIEEEERVERSSIFTEYSW
jgi:hypothetical protein